jgi:hypothetical protein
MQTLVLAVSAMNIRGLEAIPETHPPGSRRSDAAEIPTHGILASGNNLGLKRKK